MKIIPLLGRAPTSARGQSQLIDTYGRVARDLRVSLTDRCNLRCTYCMPEDGVGWCSTEQVLTTEEFNRLIRIAVEDLGIRQVRFTGGEPLLHRGLENIIAATKNLITDEGVAPVTAITTNGIGLDKRAAGLKEAGLDRVNISLDSINREHYAQLTRRDRLPSVLAGLEAAFDYGFQPVKANAVIMRGVNEDDVLPLTEFALRRGFQLRFIEQMPLGPAGVWTNKDMVTAEQIMKILQTRFDLSPAAENRGSAPAALWEVVDRTDPQLSGRIGIIASVSQSFCGDCDRTRLTYDGCIRSCLFSNEETSLRELCRSGASDNEIATTWRQAMFFKPAGHGIDDPDFCQPDRGMSQIGG
ncbi:MAG: GTP 3',8-cyclase MoaA [Chloroflexi bacterium]|nr:MAG: GTP 3',8-cyclase MoaA [Chloroflexota bacterium]